MIIVNIQSDTSLIRATIPNIMTKEFFNNHKVSLISAVGEQTLSSAYSEIVTIRYDQPLIAPIIKNNDV